MQPRVRIPSCPEVCVRWVASVCVCVCRYADYLVAESPHHFIPVYMYIYTQMELKCTLSILGVKTRFIFLNGGP